MTVSMAAWRCSSESCGRELSDSHAAGEPCPFCGHVGRSSNVVITESVRVLDSFRLKKKDSRFPSRKRVRLDEFQGWDAHRTTGEMVRKTRCIDKDADTYFEHVEDRDGNVIHHCEEPLKQHQGHGSAQFKK